jgi:uncharacterized protein
MGSLEGEDGLRKQLARLAWPTLFLFKFIVPVDKLDEVLYYFLYQDTELKISSRGKYVSVSVSSFLLNPDKVLEVYEDIGRIKGVIAL